MIPRTGEISRRIRAWPFAILLALSSVLNTQATTAQSTGEEISHQFGKFSVGEFDAEITTNAYWDNHTKYNTALYRKNKQVSLRFRLLTNCLRKCLENDLTGQPVLAFDVRENGSVDYVAISRASPGGGYCVTRCDSHSPTPVTYSFRAPGLGDSIVKNSKSAADSSVCSMVKNFKFPAPPEHLAFCATFNHSSDFTPQPSKTIFVHDNCSHP
ncbi:MAG: hypothetical protein K2X81_10565 [Candidatus Obscuribacterales bacterium]|nr:hypothetical protein [Candidatus Obscuribacterales bacterium]